MTDADRAAIDAAVVALDVSGWHSLTDAERDLVSRALAPAEQPRCAA